MNKGILKRMHYLSLAGLAGCGVGYLMDRYVISGEQGFYLVVPMGITFAVFGFFFQSKWGRELVDALVDKFLDL